MAIKGNHKEIEQWMRDLGGDKARRDLSSEELATSGKEKSPRSLIRPGEQEYGLVTKDEHVDNISPYDYLAKRMGDTPALRAMYNEFQNKQRLFKKYLD